tara:strand:- start:7123 stop:7923 length:801 start_codon:yes stop_codon:yes gene_type:complete
MEKTNKIDISVIIPIHEFNDETTKLFDIAIESIRQQKVKPDVVCIVVPKGSEADKYITKYKFDLGETIVTVVQNDGDTDFCTQVNLGIETVPTNWFSILEFDDEFSTIWFDNVVKYREAYPEVGIFMPMIADVNKDGVYIGGTNEAVWANQFSDEMGFLDEGALLRYQNFNTDGAVIRKELVEDYGGFKSKMKLTFIYEFLLRMTHNAVTTMVIPRIGYKHMNLREGSLFADYANTLDGNESKWWLDQAKKEFHWSENRELKYTTI